MKTIIIDGEVLTTDRMDGIHRFMTEILKRVDSMLPETGLEIHLVHRSTGTVKNLKVNNIKDIPLDCQGKRYRLSVLPQYVKRTGGIYCSMSNDAVMCRNSIFTIMDLIPLYKIARYPLKALVRMKLTYRLMKTYGGRIVTISRESRKDIINRLGISEGRISIVGTGYDHMNGIVSDNSIFDKYPELIKGQYYFAIGNQYPYKNFKWVQEVAGRNPDATFVVAGSKTNINGGEAQNTANMKYVGYVSDGENKALMENAKAFIHPSKLEGFGIPPLEALSLGTPVIIARASCLPEIYGDCAHYIDPDNYDVNLDKLLSEHVEPADSLLSKYTWDNVARDWLNILLQEAAKQ